MSWKTWSCQALREAGRVGKLRPTFAVAILLFGRLCVGTLCSSPSGPGTPSPTPRFLLWTQNNPPACPFQPHSHTASPCRQPWDSHPNMRLFCKQSSYWGEATESYSRCLQGCLCDWLLRGQAGLPLQRPSHLLKAADGGFWGSKSFFCQIPAFIIQTFSRMEWQQKLLQSRALGCSSS